MRTKPALDARLVYEIEELPLGHGLRWELDVIGESEMLGFVLADPRDEKRSSELPVNA